MAPRGDIMQGTLDLMVLRTLETMGPLHGWGIAQRLEQVSEDALRVNQGTLYPALLRLEQRRPHPLEVGHVREQPPRPVLQPDRQPDGGSCRPSATSGIGSPAIINRLLATEE